MEKELKEKVMQAIGEASMCWKLLPMGEFNSEKAEEVGDRLLTYIEEKIKNAFWATFHESGELWFGYSKDTKEDNQDCTESVWEQFKANLATNSNK